MDRIRLFFNGKVTSLVSLCLRGGENAAKKPSIINIPAMPVFCALYPDVTRPDYLSNAAIHEKIAQYLEQCHGAMTVGARSLARVEPASQPLSRHCLDIIANLAASARVMCRHEDRLIFNQPELADYIDNNQHIIRLLRHGYGSGMTSRLRENFAKQQDDAPAMPLSSITGSIINLVPAHIRLSHYLSDSLPLGTAPPTPHNDPGPR